MRVFLLFILFVLFIGVSPVNAAEDNPCDIFQSYSPCKVFEKSTDRRGSTLIIGQRPECFCIKCLDDGRISGQVYGRIGSYTYGNDVIANMRLNASYNSARNAYQETIINRMYGPKYVYSQPAFSSKQYHSFSRNLSDLQPTKFWEPNTKYGFQLNRAAQSSFEGNILADDLIGAKYRVVRTEMCEGNTSVLFKKCETFEISRDYRLNQKITPQTPKSGLGTSLCIGAVTIGLEVAYQHGYLLNQGYSEKEVIAKIAKSFVLDPERDRITLLDTQNSRRAQAYLTRRQYFDNMIDGSTGLERLWWMYARSTGLNIDEAQDCADQFQWKYQSAKNNCQKIIKNFYTW